MSKYVTQQSIDQYELLEPLLESAYEEMQELSKKKQESPINSYKVKAINRIIIPLKELLKEENVNSFLDILEADDLPTNSDVVFILGQYKKAMALYRKTYQIYDSTKHSQIWNLEPASKTTPTTKAKKSK